MNAPENILARIERGPGCWAWPQAHDKDGYPVVNLAGKQVRVSRVVAAAFLGDPAGKVVCHRCDNAGCVNPAHLYLGTPRENAADAVARGQIPRGERHHRAKLSDAACDLMRAEVAAGRSIQSLAEQYDVTYNRVWQIAYRGDRAKVVSE